MPLRKKTHSTIYGMTDLTDFPADPRYWFIRHIDGYIQPHKGTESTSTRCFLAPIPLGWGDPAKLSEVKISELFGIDNREMFTSTIFVGSLPTYVVGNYFTQSPEGGVYAGTLPSRQLDLGNALAKAEDSGLYRQDATGRMVDLKADTELGRKESKYILKALPARQLYLDSRTRSNTRVLIARDTSRPDEAEQVEFIIPRTVIFRAFYAYSSMTAGAFTAGPWKTVQDQLIYKKEFAGHLTGADDATGVWKIIMTLGMTLNDGPMMALLYLNPYARARAENLHNPMLIAINEAQSNGSDDAHWYTNAEIPYDPALGPYRGQVSGYYLSPRMDGHFRGRTFLVTAIHHMNFPRGLPPVAPLLVNDGRDGADVTSSSGPAPFSGANRGREKRPDGMANVDTHGASGRAPGFDMPSVSFVIDPPPQTIRLEKDHSEEYRTPRRPPKEAPTLDGSAGRKDGQVGSKSHLNSAQEPRAPSAMYHGLMLALEKMKEGGKISSFSIVPPTSSQQRVSVGAHACWNFLTAKERWVLRRGQPTWTTRSWLYVEGMHARGIPLERSALVIRITLPSGVSGFWVEIEMKGSEKLASAFVLTRGGSLDTEVTTALGIIRQVKGISLSKHFDRQGIRCYTHLHYMEKPDNTKWSSSPLESFFKSVAEDA